MGEEVTPLREPPVRSVDRVADAIVLRLAGELDLYNADEVRGALTQAIAEEPRRVVVDLSEVDFLDSTALGVLIEARSKIGRDGLVLAAPRFETKRTLQVSGIDRHLPVLESVAAALAG